jgi:hypothetical protein
MGGADITVDGRRVLASGVVVAYQPQDVVLSASNNGDTVRITIKLEQQVVSRPALKFSQTILGGAFLRVINAHSAAGISPDNLLKLGEVGGEPCYLAVIISAAQPNSAVRIEYTFYAGDRHA